METNIVKISNVRITSGSHSSIYADYTFIDMPDGVVPEKIDKVQLYQIFKDSSYAYKSEFKVLTYDSSQYAPRSYQGTSIMFEWGFTSDGKKLVIHNELVTFLGDVWIYVKA